jgi:excisionase family DNA binding protein
MVWQYPLLSQGDVAELLGVSVRTVTRLRATGELKSVRVRGKVRFERSDVADYIKTCRAAGLF